MDFIHIVAFMLLALFLYKYSTSDKFQYNVKFFSYYTSILVVSFFVAFYFMFFPKDPDNLRVPFTIWRNLWRVFRIRYEMRNLHYLESDKPYVLVSNHQSSTDVMTMVHMRPRRCTMLAKKELLYIFPFGVAAWLAGLVFVDRLNPDSSRKTMQQTAQLVVEKNIKLWVFPEGTRHLGDELLPFKKGAFHLAVQCQIPIVPVVISSYQNFLNKKQKLFKSGPVIVEALPPISTEGLTSADVTALTDKVRDQMVPVFDRLSREVGPHLQPWKTD